MSKKTLATSLIEFQAKTQLEQLIWLTEMLSKISMYARDTYDPGTDLVSKPADLRIYNELLHRVSVFAKSVAKNNSQRMSDIDLFALMANNFKRLNISEAEILEI